jgi:RNA polymerase sigma-70 factor (ECF subfamily)
MSYEPIQSFEHFYEAVKDRVWQAVLVSGRHPTRAEDAVADAFAKAYERWESVGRLENPTGWVVRVAINRYNSDWRIWRRELSDPPDARSATQDYPSDNALVGLVWRLPRRQRQVIALRVIADLSEDETGQTLGISPKTVSVHLHRALATLRSGIGAALTEEDQWKTQTSPIR